MTCWKETLFAAAAWAAFMVLFISTVESAGAADVVNVRDLERARVTECTDGQCTNWDTAVGTRTVAGGDIIEYTDGAVLNQVVYWARIIFAGDDNTPPSEWVVGDNADVTPATLSGARYNAISVVDGEKYIIDFWRRQQPIDPASSASIPSTILITQVTDKERVLIFELDYRDVPHQEASSAVR